MSMNPALLHAAPVGDARNARTRVLQAAGFEVVEAFGDDAARAAGGCQVAVLSFNARDVLQPLGTPVESGLQVLQLLPESFEGDIPDADAYLNENAPPPVLTAAVQALYRNWLRLNRGNDPRDLPKRHMEILAGMAADPVIVFDLRGRVVAMNQRFIELHEISDPHLRPRTLQNFFEAFETRRPDGTNLALGEWPVVRARDGQAVEAVEVQCRNRRTGRNWIALYNAAPVFGSGGDILFVNLTIQDITERKASARALQVSEDRFRTLTEAIPSLVWTADATGAKNFVSRQWLHYTGQRLDDALGLGWLNAAHPDDVAAVRELWGRATSGRTRYEAVYRVRRRDGAYRWHVDRAVPQFSVTGEVVQWCGATTDIQDQKDIELELRHTNQALQQSNTELKQFGYLVSHEFQEPLHMVSAFVDLLLRRTGGDLDSEIPDYLGHIAAGANRMNAMINGLLEYSRVSSEPHGESIASANAALSWATANLADSIAQTGAVLNSAELPDVYADFGRLSQVFQHLLSNALKYRSDSPLVIEVSAEILDGEARFCVADNGTGIAPAYQNRVFDMFRRLHGREVPGTGIGLALCRRIIERHGGRIWVEAQAGQGSRFYFTLPVAEDIAAAGAAG